MSEDGVDDRMVVLYHGTTPDSAAALLANGWQPSRWSIGSNFGQSRYLYLSTGVEDALWFAEQKDSKTVLRVSVPYSYLRVDPEDGVSDTIDGELSLGGGLPGKLVCVHPLSPCAFKVFSFACDDIVSCESFSP